MAMIKTFDNDFVTLDIVIKHKGKIIAEIHNCNDAGIDTDEFKSVKSSIDGIARVQTVELEV